ncbi:HD domain-containing protein, partial [Chloroflexota bacterium]
VVVDRVESWVRDRFGQVSSRGHGLPHTDRVRRNILVLAQGEAADPILAEVAALLHDVGRTEPGPEAEHGARAAAIAEPLLTPLRIPAKDSRAILHAILWHNSTRRDTPLLCLLRDADMLDGLGAMGLMRAFMSKSHLPPYHPDSPFSAQATDGPPATASDQILLQVDWYDRLNTATARRMAQERFAFMGAFMAQARREIIQGI